MEYAPFAKRLVAFIIDLILVNIVVIIVQILLQYGLCSGIGGSGGLMDRYMAISDCLKMAQFIAIIATLIIWWLYFALLESSAKQGTLGKMAMGIKVVDLDGQRLNFVKATVRYIGRIISALILFLGFFMALFTEKKQALHDLIAKTYVIQK